MKHFSHRHKKTGDGAPAFSTSLQITDKFDGTAANAKVSQRLDISQLRQLSPEAAFGSVKEYLSQQLIAGRNAPCLFCGGDDRARWDTRSGRYFCSHCQPRYMTALDLYLQVNGLSFREGCQAFAQRVGVRLESLPARPSNTAKKDICTSIWRQCRPIEKGDRYHRHLALRGLDADKIIGHRHIRHCEQLRHPDGSRHDAMVAALYRFGRFVKLQRMYLSADGSKADVSPVRACLAGGSDHMGAVVPISVNDDLSALAVTEGIETGVAVSQATDLPTVAACDAGNLEQFIPPRMTRTLFVGVDNDRSRRGLQAYHSLAAQLCKTRPDVRVIPVVAPDVGSDWADYEFSVVADSWRDVMSRQVSIPDWEVYR